MRSVLWIDTNLLRFAVPMLKLDHTRNFGKNRIITSQSYIASRMKVGTPLSNQYLSCFNLLASEPFHT